MNTPIEQYEQLKAEAKRISKEALDNVLNNIEFNESENAQTVKEYEEFDLTAKNISAKRSLFGFFGFLLKLVFVAGLLYFIYNFVEFLHDNSNKTFMTMSIVLFIGLVGYVVAYKLTIGKYLTKLDNFITDLSNMKNETKNKGLMQTSLFTGLVSENTFSDLLTQIIPIIKFDAEVSTKNMSKYNMSCTNTPTSTVVAVKTGNVEGNPFTFLTSRNTIRISHTYTGSRVIEFTDTIKYQNGTKKTKKYTETLSASVVKFVTGFNNSSSLLYYHEACGDLSFERKPVKITGDINTFVEKKTKEQAKIFKSGVSKNKDYTPLSNSEFEALFDTTQRSNEVDFRVFFSPLAQTNLSKLIKWNAKNGTDFSYIKNKQVNIISTETNSFDVTFGHRAIVDYDIKNVKEKFLNKFIEFFDQAFFSLAPILSIPDLVEKCDQTLVDNSSNFPSEAHEMLINSLPNEFYTPQGCQTNTIVKTSIIQKYDNADHVLVNTTGYTINKECDLVSVKAKKDGSYHNVPVYWDNYIPVTSQSNFVILKTPLNELQFLTIIETLGLEIFVKNGIFDFIIGYLIFVPNEEFETKEIIDRINERIKERLGE